MGFGSLLVIKIIQRQRHASKREKTAQAWLKVNLYVCLVGPSNPAEQVVPVSLPDLGPARNAGLSQLGVTPRNAQATPQSRRPRGSQVSLTPEGLPVFSDLRFHLGSAFT